MSIYDKASLVQIPSGYKSGTLYSVVPNTADGDFTVSSDADATRVNKDGLVETTVADQARLNYDPTNPQDPHLLLEPTRTNNLLRSEEFDNPAWTKFSAGTGTTPVVTANYTTSPDGSNNADRVIFDKGSGTGGSDLSQMRQIVTDVGQGISSVYIKSNTNDNYTMGIDPVGNATLITVTPEWQRFTYSETTNDRLAIGLRGSQTSNYADVSVWGAQMEAGDYPTSYIPTVGSAVTRTADNAQIASGAGDIIGSQNEGTLFIDLEIPYDTTSSDYFQLCISDQATTDNRVLINFRSQKADFQVFSGGSGVGFCDTPVTKNTRLKIAGSYKTNEFILFKNGTLADTIDTLGTVNFTTQMETIRFADFGNGLKFQAKVHQVMFFQEALTQDELQTLTT